MGRSQAPSRALLAADTYLVLLIVHKLHDDTPTKILPSYLITLNTYPPPPPPGPEIGHNTIYKKKY